MKGQTEEHVGRAFVVKEDMNLKNVTPNKFWHERKTYH